MRGPLSGRLGICLVSLLAMITWGECAPSHAAQQGGPALIVLNTADSAAMQQVLASVKSAGGVIHHSIPPHVVIADLTAEGESSLARDPRIDIIARDVVDPKMIPAGYGQVARDAVTAWNEVFVLAETAAPSEAPPGLPLIGDVRQVPPEVRERLKAKAAPAPPGADMWQTSEYMMGSTTISLIFLESNGGAEPSTENWSGPETTKVVSNSLSGMNWWTTTYPYTVAPLSFTWEYHYAVPTSYEPITRDSSQDYLWIIDALTALGYPCNISNYWDVLYAYNNDLRNSHDTDWAFTVFVVDSSNDSDGMFADGYFAYAWMNGPAIMLTYDNDGYTIDQMHTVLTHEAGHIFGADDEYCQINYSCCNPDAFSGYLRVQNTNCQRDPICIMNNNSPAVCLVSRQQLGWRDSDVDGIPDILDVAPTASLNSYSPDPADEENPIFTGNSAVSFFPNNNPIYDGPDVTLNRIASVQYRIDGGPWFEAQAADGAFDEANEAYNFQTASLDNGTYLFEVRALDSSGNASAESYPSDTLQIQLHLRVLPEADPLIVPSEGTLQLSGSAEDLEGHSIVSYSWNDGGAGGVFLPSVTITGPAYTALENQSGTDLPVVLSLSATCDGIPPKTKTKSVTITVAWDFDGDGMPDYWEQENGFDKLAPGDAALDADSDGLTNLEEYDAGTNPGSGDTDADGMPDAWELEHGLNPISAADVTADADNDGLGALGEYQQDSDPTNRDTDGDGFGDGEEVSLGSDPASAGSKPAAGHFSDVPPTGYGTGGASPFWAFHEIEACYRAGIVSGYEGGIYQPSWSVSRDQMATYIARALAGGDDKVPQDYTTPSFTDIPATHWAFNYIEYTAEQNIVRGYDDGSGSFYYAPAQLVDRGTMAVYIARSIVTPIGDDSSLPRPIVPTFGDVPTEFWAYAQVEYCYDEGVVMGYDDGFYYPGNIVSRDQMAVYISRAFNLPR